MSFTRVKVLSSALFVAGLVNRQFVNADSLGKPVAIGSDTGSTVDMPVNLPTSGVDGMGGMDGLDGLDGLGGEQYGSYDAYEIYEPYGSYEDMFGSFDNIGGAGRGLDLGGLFEELFGDLQVMMDPILADGNQMGPMDGLTGLNLTGILDGIDIQGLLDQLSAELGNINFTDAIQPVFDQVQPVIDAAMSCASNATVLAQPAEACMQSIAGTWDMEEMEDMDDDMDMGGTIIEGPALRKLRHMGGRGGFDGRGMFGGGLEMLDASALCTPACQGFFDQVATTCPDLATIVFNGTSTDICSGVEPGSSGGGAAVLEPLPAQPVANVTAPLIEPVLLPETPASNDSLPALIPLENTQGGTAFVAGEPSSASIARAVVAVLVAVSVRLVGF